MQINSLATDLASGINPYGGTLPVARSIPSAATLLLPPNGCNGRTVATVSGTTNITDIAGMCPNEELTLIFDGVLTVTHGNHIPLAGGASFTTATHSLLRMFCFPILGTMYCKEVARAL